MIGLKVILCYDSDIIMVGEIRDSEIVKIVVRVVFIGYLVLIMMYIKDIKGFLYRLFEFGVSF